MRPTQSLIPRLAPRVCTSLIAAPLPHSHATPLVVYGGRGGGGAGSSSGSGIARTSLAPAPAPAPTQPRAQRGWWDQHEAVDGVKGKYAYAYAYGYKAGVEAPANLGTSHIANAVTPPPNTSSSTAATSPSNTSAHPHSPAPPAQAQPDTKPRESTVPAPTLAWCDFLSMV